MLGAPGPESSPAGFWRTPVCVCAVDRGEGSFNFNFFKALLLGFLKCPKDVLVAKLYC